MTVDVRRPPDTVADVLARRVQTRQGTVSARAEALRELGAVDRAVYDAVARTPTATLDGPVCRLSAAADHSRLWLAIAAAIGMLGGGRGCRAALEGVVSVGITSWPTCSTSASTAGPCASNSSQRATSRTGPPCGPR
jgi:hypothetical protein